MLSKSLILFSVDEWGCVHSSFGLRPDYGRSDDDLLQKDLCQHATSPKTTLSVPLIQWQATINPCICQRLPNTHKQIWLSLLCGHCYFLLGPYAHKVCLFVCFSPTRVSVSPVLWKLCNQIPLTFKVRFPEDSQSFCWIFRLGSLLWGLELLQQWENLFGITVLQFVEYPPSGSIVWLMVISSKKTCTTSCVPQNSAAKAPVPMPCRRPSNTYRQVWLDLLWGAGVVVTVPFLGSWCTQGFICALQASLAGMRIDFQWDCTPPVALLLYLLCPWMWGVVSFFGGFQHPLDDCSALIVILVLSQEKISACPSTPPSCC